MSPITFRKLPLLLVRCWLRWPTGRGLQSAGPGPNG